MTELDPQAGPSKANGRRTALIVVLVAFVASATTAILAISESHRAVKSDAAALAADVTDLRGMATDWTASVDELGHAPSDAQPGRLEELKPQVDKLTSWKARTPCGHDARDALRASVDTRVLYLQRVLARETVPEAHIDERRALEDSLQRCASEKGGDVNI
jgi:hypothetical protein